MVNSNEAPKGYMAVACVVGNSSCDKCSFASNDCGCRAEGVSCLSSNRNDNCGVYFIPKKEQEEMSHADTQPVQSVIPGISLRDYFAGCAISGCMNASEEVYKVPERAYIVADAMLKEREKASNGGDNAAIY